MLTVAILAGGLATRLRPITHLIPKSLVDVAGEPFIVRQLEYLHRQGVTDVVLCIGYLGEQVKALVGDGSSFGLNVVYSSDGEQLMGTGGALRQAIPLLGKVFFVFYGDSYLPIDFRQVEEAFFKSGKPALMSVLRNADLWDKSNVLFRDGFVLEYNKREPTPEMAYIDYGLGVMSAEFLSSKSLNEPFDLADIYHNLSVQGNLAGYEVYERFYEIGSLKGLQETVNYFKNKDLR